MSAETKTAEQTRPSHHDSRVILAAAKALAPDVIEWLGDDAEGDEAHIIAELEAAIRWESDGYALAQALDHWAPDAELVEILDRAGHAKWEARNKLVKEWVSQADVRLEFPLGAIVTCRQGIGKITGLRQETAEYVVTPEGDPRFALGGGWIIAGEDCSLAVEEA